MSVVREVQKLVTDRIWPAHFADRDFRRDSAAGAAFNGQSGRAAIAAAIVTACRIESIVETGTYLGATTAWFAELGLPIQTVEANRRNAHYARLRLARCPNVRTVEADSVLFLDSLGRDDALTRLTTLFYLDAHWGKRLPLAQELQRVVRFFPRAVVMIDDFCVPDDPGYRFDEYGPRRRLDLDYVKRTGIAPKAIFFPRLRGEEETGARRGCVILATNAALADKLSGIPLLREWRTSS